MKRFLVFALLILCCVGSTWATQRYAGLTGSHRPYEQEVPVPFTASTRATVWYYTAQSSVAVRDTIKGDTVVCIVELPTKSFAGACWFAADSLGASDALGYVTDASDSTQIQYRPLAELEDANLVPGSALIPIAFRTVTPGTGAVTVNNGAGLDWNDRQLYVSYTPDSLGGLRGDAFNPPACGFVEVYVFSTAALPDTIPFKLNLRWAVNP